MKTGKIFYYGKFAVLGVVALAAFTLVVMWLWNWLVPELFKGPLINYWQTLGLLVLSKIIFTGIGKGHSDHDQKSYEHFRERWKRKYHKKMNGIAEEKVEDAKTKTEGSEEE